MSQIIHLAYHHIRAPEELQPTKNNCSRERFVRQMEFFAKNGWQVVSCAEFIKLHYAGRLPEQIATVSFDDGYKDGFRHAFPILQNFGFRGTFFIISNTLNGRLYPSTFVFQVLGITPDMTLDAFVHALPSPHRKTFRGGFDLGNRYPKDALAIRKVKIFFSFYLPYALRDETATNFFAIIFGAEEKTQREKELCNTLFMTPDEMKKLAAADMEIGSHSVTHAYLGTTELSDATQLTAAETAKEARESSATLKARLDIEPVTFAWPLGGEFGAGAKAEIAKCYQTAWNYSRNPDQEMQPPYDLFNIPRFDETCFEEVLGIPLLKT